MKKQVLSVLAVTSVLLLTPVIATAACNLIPAAAEFYPSVMGTVATPLTAPGETIHVELNGCDGSPGFAPLATDNQVIIRFEPPAASGGNNTSVTVNSEYPALLSTFRVAKCKLPGRRCKVLEFEMPDTTGLVLPAPVETADKGLAGPARITVQDPSLSAPLVAEIAELNIPAVSCDKEQETVFRTFTVLPNATNFKQLAGGTVTEVLATVDGGGNLLIPFDYWGGGPAGGPNTVLFDDPGSPLGVFIEGDASIQANLGSPETIGEKLNMQSNPSAFVRSFTLDGRPLPPLLRVKKNGAGFYGVVDAVASVIRVQADDEMGDNRCDNGTACQTNSDCAGIGSKLCTFGMGGTLFEVADRMSASGRGAIVLLGSSANVRDPLPLNSLRASDASVAYTRDESREGQFINPDADQADLVAQVLNADNATVTNTHEAVTEIANNFFIAPALITAGDRVAFLLSELGQGGSLINADINADGDDNDNIVRVFRRNGDDLVNALVNEDASVARLVNGQALAISADKVFFRGPGAFIEAHFDGDPSDSSALGGAFGVAMDSDGQNVYVTSRDENALVVYDRNASTGELVWREDHIDGLGVDGLQGATGVAVTPDGKHVYVAGEGENKVAIFSRNLSTGALTPRSSVAKGDPGLAGMTGPRAIAVSPDSNFVYVGTFGSDSIISFSRDLTSGALAPIDVDQNGFGGVNGIQHVEGVAITSDGKHLYATGVADDAVAAFSRNPGTGTLSFIEFEKDGDGGVNGIEGASTVAISPDDKHVYVAGAKDQALAVFERNATTGELSFTDAYFDGENGLTTLLGTFGLAVSPDGQRVYATARVAGAGNRRGAVSIFRRNAETGRLLFEDAMFDGVAGFEGFASPLGVAVDPVNGKHIYVAGNDSGSVAVLGTEHLLKVLDTTGTGSGNLLAMQEPASRVAVAAERAVYLRPESADGRDRNDSNDSVEGDAHDDIVAVYDTSATAPVDPVTILNIAGNRVAISDTLVAFTVPEANQELWSTENGNGDGDKLDDILFIYKIGDPVANMVNTRATAGRISVVGNTVFYVSPDNGSLNRYDYDPTTNSGASSPLRSEATDFVVEDFVVEGNLIAFRVDETAMGEDLNLDGDQLDLVMFYDDLTDAAPPVNVQRAALQCFLPACDPNLPYKVTESGPDPTKPSNRSIAFLTSEPDDGPDGGRDLNLDGDKNDIVLSIHSVRSGFTDTVGDVINDGATCSAGNPDKLGLGCVFDQDCDRSPGLGDGVCGTGNKPETSPLPDDPFDGTLITREVRESDIDFDVNGDGDKDDIVVVLVGDSDEDGSIDDLDVCREKAGADQSDFDRDGLGDVDCDPILPPACGTVPRGSLCRAPGKSILQFKHKAGTKKDKLKWKWGKGAETLFAAFADPDTRNKSYYSLCIYENNGGDQLIGAAVVLPQRFCGKKPCWRAIPGKGFKFKDKAGVPFGITGLALKAGGLGKAKLSVKAKGDNLTVPTLTPAPLLPVTAQLIVDTGSGEECWTASFTTVLKQRPEQWKAKAP